MTDVADTEELIDEEPVHELDETSSEFIDLLVKKLVLFTEQFCDVELFPYQLPIAYRTIESIVIGDGEELTLIATRQSGKSEVLSNVMAAMMVILPKLAKVYPTWLGKFEKGFLVGVFAPVEDQADTVFSRIVSRLTSDHAMDFLLDPEIDDKTTSGGSRGKGRAISLKNSGSLCRMQTCNPKAKIESKTYHFILVDEAQEADEVMITKSIKPMLAFNNGTIMLTGTAVRNKSYFYKAIQYNKRRDVNARRGHRQAHFEYDWRVAAKYNENYARFISKEKLRIGEDSDEFQMSYCGTANNSVLTSDLINVGVSFIRPGDSLLAFDEERPGPGLHRQLRHTKVVGTSTRVLPCSRIELDDGTLMEFSNDHKWLVQTAGGRTEWKRTEDLTAQDRIWRITGGMSWEPLHPGYEIGYLRAAFDGEGCLSVVNGKVQQIQFAQRDNAMLVAVKRYLTHQGFEYEEYRYDHSGTNGDVVNLVLRGGRSEVIRFLMTVRPERLIQKFRDLEGPLGSIGKSRGSEQHPRVVSVTPIGDQTVYAIKTSTATYIANGLASHNCNRWILEKGMFVTDERLERMYDQSMGLVKQWWRTPVVVGIDVARSNDSTVVTVVWVDWDHPDGFGFYEHRVLNWLEINNLEWEKQYFEIIDFLRNYDVFRVGVDSQGVGGAVAERLQILLPHIEVLAVSSDAKTQNDRWVHLTELIQRDQLVVPGHSKARRTKNWKRFNQQMLDLEKVHRGPYLLAAAPDEKGAFDDYPDSLAIACNLTQIDTMPQISSSESPFYR